MPKNEKNFPDPPTYYIDKEPSALTLSEAPEFIERLRETLWPTGDEEHQWSPDTLDEISNLFHEYNLAPTTRE